MAHPHLDDLLDYSLKFAQQLLKKYGEFYPFAAYVGLDGKVTPVGIQADNEHPKSQEMIDQYTALLKHLASTGEANAVALCYDSRVSLDGGPKKDAISVALEDSSGDCMACYLPYKKKTFGGYQYDPVSGLQAERRFFG
jgi:hypothetical protein